MYNLKQITSLYCLDLHRLLRTSVQVAEWSKALDLGQSCDRLTLKAQDVEISSLHWRGFESLPEHFCFCALCSSSGYWWLVPFR